MMIKTFQIALGVLVAFSVWSVALLVFILALHVLLIGGFVVYHLMNP